MKKRYGLFLVTVLVLTSSLAGAVGTFGRLDNTKLQETIAAYMGTPYQYGGTTRNGIDCSGFVLSVYREQGINLPRAARDQYRVGESVPRERLQPGDLVFFNTTGRGVSHVGIVKEPGVFAHASTSRGVTTDQLSGSYWGPRYMGARRVASGATFLVSGENVGAAASDAIVLTNNYPFIDYELINVPTNRVGSPRTASLQLTTSRDGRVVIHPQISLWQRLQLAAYFPIDDALGSGTPEPDWPEFLIKVRFMDQWNHIPGFAVGYDFRKNRIEHETDFYKRGTNIDSIAVTERRRGLFFVGSGAVLYDQNAYVGKTMFHAGAALHTFKDVSFSDDVSGFIGIEQQLLRRVTLFAEMDNILGEGGWVINAGARVSITDGAVVEYDITNLRSTKVSTNRIMKFSFNVPF